MNLSNTNKDGDCMTVWERYSDEQREEYKDYLKMYGALSAMFNQKSSETGAPYLDSKFQETIYAKSFNSEDVDIGNTPHDIRSTFGNYKVGIGIKTWLSSKPSYQKVMQLKRYKDEINPYVSEETKDELAYAIAKIKNERLITDYKRLGLKVNENIYHYVTRDKGQLSLSETSYPLVDMDKLKPGKLAKSSFTFTDGHKKYRYTFGDSQIWMRFGETEPDTYLLDKINIEILEDPFAFLRNAFKNYKENNGMFVPSHVIQRDYLYLPLYSYKTKEVAESSGLNAWNGKPKTKGSTTVRPEGEAYIPIPKALWKKHPYWVDPNVDMRKYNEYKQKTGQSSYKINLHMPDGQVFEALFAQSDFKGLQTDPQSILGKWILNVLGITHPVRERYDKPAEHIVTMKLLQQIGYDSVKLWHEDPNNLREVWIDFAEYGSFERFMKDED
ncbi:phospholipase D-like domain-containing protein [Limosilactobacillus reuteri]|nr:NgoFVII family restriction endonuclease [Limosilactobacillus reuteri]